MTHYTAMSRSGGCTLTDDCAVFADRESAIDYLTNVWELDAEDKAELRQENRFVHYGVDYAHLLEIAVCNCNDLFIHQSEILDRVEFYREFCPITDANGKYKPAISVDDLRGYPEFAFVSDSQDVEDLKSVIGGHEFDSFFVSTGGGDYIAVYGMRGIVPYDNRVLQLVYPYAYAKRHPIEPTKPERNYGAELDTFMRIANDRPYQSDMCNRCREVHSMRSSCKMPDAPYYVLAKDTFMSNWRLSNGTQLVGTNIVVVPCANFQEAETIESWINHNRTDMTNVNVVKGKPKYRSDVKYSLMLEFRYHALGREIPYYDVELAKRIVEFFQALSLYAAHSLLNKE